MPTGTGAAATEPLDPVCAFHGKRRSEHVCLYCCLCFCNLTPEACWVDGEGQKWDICIECGDAQLAAQL